MIAVIEQPKKRPEEQVDSLPRLENGDHLTASEFMRRYERMPEIKKAELVGGIVYMASPVRLDQHGEPDGLVQTWLGTYSIGTPGVKHAVNTTVRLGSDDVLQPDGLLRIDREFGGVANVDENGYLIGPPELAVEVAASSVSIDTREKLNAYRRAGVREYVVWRTQEKAIDWWSLEGDDFVPLPREADGILRSRIFAGLWLDEKPLLAGNGAAVMARLQEGLKSPEHKAFVESLHAKAK